MEQVRVYQDEQRKWRWRCAKPGGGIAESDECFDSCHACVDDAVAKGYLSEAITRPRETPAT
jgi:hypothetical protein